VDRPGEHAAAQSVYEDRDAPGVSGATGHGGTRLSREQESCRQLSGGAGATGTEGGVGHAHRRGVPGVGGHPTAGSPLSAGACAATTWEQRSDCPPTAAVAFALWTPGMRVHVAVDHAPILHVHGLGEDHRILGKAVGMDPPGIRGPQRGKMHPCRPHPLNVGCKASFHQAGESTSPQKKQDHPALQDGLKDSMYRSCLRTPFPTPHSGKPKCCRAK